MALKKIGGGRKEAPTGSKKSARPRKVGRAGPTVNEPTSFDRVVSTGSTLLDLAISGGRVRGGGIPGGKMVEIYGPEGTGKTAILGEVCKNAQDMGGEVMYLDPEGRFDIEYARLYGLRFKAGRYVKPDTVEEFFQLLRGFPAGDGSINVMAADSLAAFSTKMEMSNNEADKQYGRRKAMLFSEGLRKHSRIISNAGSLLICSNQMRETDYGTTTPGGRGIRYWSSIRIEIKHAHSWRIESTRKIKSSGKEVTKQVGIISTARVVKSSVDEPHRSADIYVMFGYGMDDIRANLQYLKTMRRDTVYGFDKATRAQSMGQAIRKIEDNGREQDLREQVIDQWEEVENEFKGSGRKPKYRK